MADLCENCEDAKALYFCTDCGMRLCGSEEEGGENCEADLHLRGKTVSHHRVRLDESGGDKQPDADELPEGFCENCEEESAAFDCAECGLAMCKNCDEEMHAFGRTKNHTRSPVASAGGSGGADPGEPSSTADGETVMCENCEEFPAEVHCDDCDMDMCGANGDNCDGDMHARGKAASHHRVPLSGASAQSADSPDDDGSGIPEEQLCENCESYRAEVKCDECDMILCADKGDHCDGDLHMRGKAAQHVRHPVDFGQADTQPAGNVPYQPSGKPCASCQADASVWCQTCELYLCGPPPNGDGCDSDRHDGVNQEHVRIPAVEQAEIDKQHEAEAQAEKERQERAQAEQERIERERAETERLEREQAEKERLEREQAEKDRLEREQAEKERLEREQAEQDHIEREQAEKDRLEREQAEKERLEREQAEKEQAEKDRLEREQAEKERLEREQAEQEQAERDRLEREQAEKERLEREQAETERLERERAETERLERAQAEKDRIEREKLERERLEQAESERMERERAARERLEREQAEQDRLEREQAERERLEREKAEQQRLERERAERDRLERERVEKERAERERRERAAAEQAEMQRLQREQEQWDRAQHVQEEQRQRMDAAVRSSAAGGRTDNGGSQQTQTPDHEQLLRDRRAQELAELAGLGAATSPISEVSHEDVFAAAISGSATGAPMGGPSQPSQDMCQVCEEFPADVWCDDCQMGLCAQPDGSNCDGELHTGMSHSRRPLGTASHPPPQPLPAPNRSTPPPVEATCADTPAFSPPPSLREMAVPVPTTPAKRVAASGTQACTGADSPPSGAHANGAAQHNPPAATRRVEPRSLAPSDTRRSGENSSRAPTRERTRRTRKSVKPGLSKADRENALIAKITAAEQKIKYRIGLLQRRAALSDADARRLQAAENSLALAQKRRDALLLRREQRLVLERRNRLINERVARHLELEAIRRTEDQWARQRDDRYGRTVVADSVGWYHDRRTGGGYVQRSPAMLSVRGPVDRPRWAYPSRIGSGPYAAYLRRVRARRKRGLGFDGRASSDPYAVGFDGSKSWGEPMSDPRAFVPTEGPPQQPEYVAATPARALSATAPVPVEHVSPQQLRAVIREEIERAMSPQNASLGPAQHINPEYKQDIVEDEGAAENAVAMPATLGLPAAASSVPEEAAHAASPRDLDMPMGPRGPAVEWSPSYALPQSSAKSKRRKRSRKRSRRHREDRSQPSSAHPLGGNPQYGFGYPAQHRERLFAEAENAARDWKLLRLRDSLMQRARVLKKAIGSNHQRWMDLVNEPAASDPNSDLSTRKSAQERVLHGEVTRLEGELQAVFRAMRKCEQALAGSEHNDAMSPLYVPEHAALLRSFQGDWQELLVPEESQQIDRVLEAETVQAVRTAVPESASVAGPTTTAASMPASIPTDAVQPPPHQTVELSYSTRVGAGPGVFPSNGMHAQMGLQLPVSGQYGPQPQQGVSSVFPGQQVATQPQPLMGGGQAGVMRPSPLPLGSLPPHGMQAPVVSSLDGTAVISPASKTGPTVPSGTYLRSDAPSSAHPTATGPSTLGVVPVAGISPQDAHLVHTALAALRQQNQLTSGVYGTPMPQGALTGSTEPRSRSHGHSRSRSHRRHHHYRHHHHHHGHSHRSRRKRSQKHHRRRHRRTPQAQPSDRTGPHTAKPVSASLFHGPVGAGGYVLTAPASALNSGLYALPSAARLTSPVLVQGARLSLATSQTAQPAPTLAPSSRSPAPPVHVSRPPQALGMYPPHTATPVGSEIIPVP